MDQICDFAAKHHNLKVSSAEKMGTLPIVEIKTLAKENTPQLESADSAQGSFNNSISYRKNMELDTCVVFIVAKDSFRYRIKYPASTIRYLQFQQVCLCENGSNVLINTSMD